MGSSRVAKPTRLFPEKKSKKTKMWHIISSIYSSNCGSNFVNGLGLPKTIRNDSSPFRGDIQLAVSPQICEQSTKVDILPQIGRGIPRTMKHFKSTWNRVRQLRASRCGLFHLIDHVDQGTGKWPGIDPGFWGGHVSNCMFRIAMFQMGFSNCMFRI